MPAALVSVIFFVAASFGLIMFIAVRYKKVPPDKVLVVFGAGPAGQPSARILDGGGALVLPIVQGHAWLDRTPIPIDLSMTDSNGRAVPIHVTVGLGHDPELLQNAAERLLHRPQSDIADLTTQVLRGHIDEVLSHLTTDQVHADQGAFIHLVASAAEPNLAKVGLVIVHAGLTEARDASGTTWTHSPGV